LGTIQNTSAAPGARKTWDRRKLAGPKTPLQPEHVWAIRTALLKRRKLRGRDAVGLKVEEAAPKGCTVERCQYALRRNSPNRGVIITIFRSSQIDQFSIYSRS
jgi:hypothetical protein